MNTPYNYLLDQFPASMKPSRGPDKASVYVQSSKSSRPSSHKRIASVVSNSLVVGIPTDGTQHKRQSSTGNKSQIYGHNSMVASSREKSSMDLSSLSSKEKDIYGSENYPMSSHKGPRSNIVDILNKITKEDDPLAKKPLRENSNNRQTAAMEVKSYCPVVYSTSIPSHQRSNQKKKNIKISCGENSSRNRPGNEYSAMSTPDFNKSRASNIYKIADQVNSSGNTNNSDLMHGSEGGSKVDLMSIIMKSLQQKNVNKKVKRIIPNDDVKENIGMENLVPLNNYIRESKRNRSGKKEMHRKHQSFYIPHQEQTSIRHSRESGEREDRHSFYENILMHHQEAAPRKKNSLVTSSQKHGLETDDELNKKIIIFDGSFKRNDEATDYKVKEMDRSSNKKQSERTGTTQEDTVVSSQTSSGLEECADRFVKISVPTIMNESFLGRRSSSHNSRQIQKSLHDVKKETSYEYWKEQKERDNHNALLNNYLSEYKANATQTLEDRLREHMNKHKLRNKLIPQCHISLNNKKSSRQSLGGTGKITSDSPSNKRSRLSMGSSNREGEHTTMEQKLAHFMQLEEEQEFIRPQYSSTKRHANPKAQMNGHREPRSGEATSKHKKNSKSMHAPSSVIDVAAWKPSAIRDHSPMFQRRDNTNANVSYDIRNLGLSSAERKSSLVELQEYGLGVSSPAAEKLKMNSSTLFEDDKVYTEFKNKLRETNAKSFRAGKRSPRTTLDYYKLLKVVGRGAFGVVYLGLHVLTGQKVAIKAIEKGYLKDQHSKRKVLQEIAILKTANHRNVIQLLEVFEDTEYLFIVLEYASSGDLLTFVKERKKLGEDLAKKIFIQIAAGTRHCHQSSILHRDIKLDNILLDQNYIVKLCDFGVSRNMKEGEVIKERCGTPAYIAPEVIINKGYEGYASDVWSMGIVLYAMVSGAVPFKGRSVEDLHRVILAGRYSFSDTLSHDCKDLIHKMLKQDPQRRITLDEILNHKWFEREVDMDRRSSIRHLRHASLRDIEHHDIERRKNFKILDAIVKKVEELGYPKDYVIKSVLNNCHNHASACYFLIYKELTEVLY